MRFYVRDMRLEDITQAQVIDREAFPNDWPPADFKREMQNSMASFMVAVENGAWRPPPPPSKLAQLASRLRHGRANPSTPPLQEQLAGFCGLWFMLDEAHITTIAVDKAARRQGIGELLLAASVDKATEKACKYVVLEVRASNIVAQNLYRKYGFLEVGARPGYYSSNREDALVMTTEAITSAPFQARFQGLKQELAQRLATSTAPK